MGISWSIFILTLKTVDVTMSVVCIGGACHHCAHHASCPESEKRQKEPNSWLFW